MLDLSPIPKCSFSSSFAAVRSLDSKPTLPELFYLETSSGSVNIVKQIGTHYSRLGPLLLSDDMGAVTSAIIVQYQRDADAINQEILTRWLQGQGKQPVTWSTLTDVMRDVGLSDLARLIKEALTSSAHSFCKTVNQHIMLVMVKHFSSFSLHSRCQSFGSTTRLYTSS